MSEIASEKDPVPGFDTLRPFDSPSAGSGYVLRERPMGKAKRPGSGFADRHTAASNGQTLTAR